MTSRQVALRLPLLATVALALLVGMGAGLARLGIAVPGVTPGAMLAHGPLMIGGVLGALICLERVVALSVHGGRYVVAYLAPLVTGIGGLLLVLGMAGPAPGVLITAGSVGLLLMFALLLRRHVAAFTVVMALGAVCWLVGNLLWLSGQPVYAVVHWWVAFLVLTVVGERLELSRIARPSEASRRVFLLVVAVFFAGVALTAADLDLGTRLAGLGELGLAVWLLRYDLSRHTVRRGGLPRFIAACLLVGYVWLGIGGLFGIAFGAVRAGIQYEALLHALLLGFIFSMIFGHALIIIPAITGRVVQFHRALYLPLVLLHASLVVRVAAGLLGAYELRQWGALFNVIAILLFFATLMWRRGAVTAAESRPGPVAMRDAIPDVG